MEITDAAAHDGEESTSATAVRAMLACPPAPVFPYPTILRSVRARPALPA